MDIGHDPPNFRLGKKNANVYLFISVVIEELKSVLTLSDAVMTKTVNINKKETLMEKLKETISN